MSEITIRLKLYPRQHDFYICPDRFAAFVGGIGSGKTFVGSLWGIQQASIPGTLGLVIAPTYPMLRDVAWRAFIEIGGEAIAEKKRGEMILTVRGGGEILFRSADNPDRLRGPNVHWALLDEAALCPRETWDVTIGRLRADGTAGPCRIVTTPKGRNWLYERQSEMTIFKAATKENPYLSPEFVSSLERSYTGNFARQELYGEFVAFEGLVYPMFSRDVHVVERPASEFKSRWFGNDEGYTNPSVILDVGVDNDGRLHVFREWYRRGQLQDTVVAVNLAWYNETHPEGIVVDSSAAGLIAAMCAVGLPALWHKGRVQDGISKVQNLLAIAGDGKPRLTIDPSCVQTIAEAESYCWKEGRDEPEKQNDHAWDTIRYIVDATTSAGWSLGPAS
jgi:phage terminase large subunit-like protein